MKAPYQQQQKKQPQPQPQHDRFDNYLSDGSNDLYYTDAILKLTEGHSDTVFATGKTAIHKNDRKYLHRNIMTTPEQQEPASLLFEQSYSTRSARPSWGTIGRRLSMGNTNSRLNQAPVGTSAVTRRAGISFSTSRSEAKGNSDNSNTKTRVSWIGAIKTRIRGHRHRGISDDTSDMTPIVRDYIRDIEAKDCQAQESSLPIEVVPEPYYPRLRSQPSLCQSNKTPITADNTTFAADADNESSRQLRETIPPRQYQPSRRLQFLLPNSSVAHASSYNALKDREDCEVAA
ncbi:hypothetical protein LPJ66_002347 [Kickxella alabastrina]|uniref:Uncharacterized protein n=1 Tax=Kickxella alabastrina TaxID=61397 RepID=A0ACC1IQS3_9FUNG|nr:hypothetical protein LPJ66_002347 [Kickxella alabastrina]